MGISPNGTTETNPVTLVWQSDPYADSYWLWVEGSSLDWEDFVDADQAGCAGGTGTCTFTLPVNLSDGAHTWWVLPANNLGYGVWSAGLSFSIGTQPQPNPPTIISPVGTYNLADPDVERPDAEWTPVPGTQTYITYTHGLKVEYTPAEAGCADEVSTCKTSLNGFLPLDVELSFAVEALSDYPLQINDQYNFDVQASSTFRLVQHYDVCQPGQGIPISPNNVSVTDPVTFTWQEDTCKYGVQIGVSGTNWTRQLLSGSDYECSGDPAVCSYKLTDISLAPGDYTWKIVPFTRAKGGEIYGDWSADTPFKVINSTQMPGKGVVVSPSRVTNPIPPLAFVWKADYYATRYELKVSSNEAGYSLDIWINGADVGCPAGTTGECRYVLGDTLSSGTYFWSILPANDAGSGTWSDSASFTISEVPGQIVVLRPADMEKVQNPVTFSWEQYLPLPTTYSFTLKNMIDGTTQSTTISFQDAHCTTVGGPATCSYTYDSELASARYEWEILPSNEYGNGSKGSIWFDVKESSHALPGTGVAISPNEVEITNPVTFVWMSDPLATKYGLTITIANSMDYVIGNLLTSAQAGCENGGTCSFTFLQQFEPGSYEWFVLPQNEYGSGEASEKMIFYIPEVN